MDSNPQYYRHSIGEVEHMLNTSLKTGLSSDEAGRRLAQYGQNEFIRQKGRSLLIKFLEQFKSFMIIVLLAAAAISGVVGYMHGEGFTDAIIILVIVLLNASIGVVQETKAEKSLEALEKLSAPHCKVIRNGQVQVIESRNAVPGDVVVLDTGDAIPADIRLTEAINLKVQEAALTGESVPEEKFTEHIQKEDVPLGDRDNLVFSSCTVTYGRGKGIVVATGMNTEVGKIAAMIQSVPDVKTPLQQKLDTLGKYLGIAALVICTLIFGAGVLHGKDMMEMFMTAVSLAAAAIPEGLPAVSTIVLAVGVQRLVKKNAIVRTLPAVEALGSTSVICSDKTGTLTQNRMTVVKLFTDNSTAEVSRQAGSELNSGQSGLLEAAVLANDAKLSVNGEKWETTGDPTETALLDVGMKFGINRNTLETERPRIAEIPFDSERKMMTTVHRLKNNALALYTKGGLDEVLACCDTVIIRDDIQTLTDDKREFIKAANREMAGGALRVLAVAFSRLDELPSKAEPATLEKGLTFAGMLGMIDPPRPEVKVAVAKCRTAGIMPVMITGDHKITAVAIADELGIKGATDEACTGADVEKMTDDELLAHVGRIAVYARVSPEHKVRIVKAFQKKGAVVAMTGDGVNDAPALKLADVGAAMGIVGTDVSKEAADIILTDDNFATIVVAVEEGRRIYDNIIKAVQFMLSTNIGEIVVLFVAVMAGWHTPLLPIHILWINLVTDSLPALALSVDPAGSGIMHRKPIDPKQGIMTRDFSIRVFLQGGMIGLLSITAFLTGMQSGSVETARTMTFAVLAFTQLAHVFNVRSRYSSAFKGMLSNKYLLGAIAVVVLLMLAVLELPALHNIFHLTALTRVQWLQVACLSIAPLLIVELAKGIIRLVKNKKLFVKPLNTIYT
jgi:Ca2+-transporting ATPase